MTDGERTPFESGQRVVVSWESMYPVEDAITEHAGKWHQAMVGACLPMSSELYELAGALILGIKHPVKGGPPGKVVLVRDGEHWKLLGDDSGKLRFRVKPMVGAAP